MELTQKKLEEILIPPSHITKEQFQSVLELSKHKSISLERLLVEEGLITDDNLGRAIANYFDYHFVDLHKVKMKDDFLEYIPEIVARAQQAIIFGTEDTTLKLATHNTDNYEFVRFLEKKTGKKVEMHYTSRSSFETALKYYRGDLLVKIKKHIDDLTKDQQGGDVVSFVNLLLEYASDNRVSDIHIEPLEEEVLIRFRVDGILHEVVRYSKIFHEKVVFRLKIMSHLQTDEHAAAQDGRFDYTYEGDAFDVRVSIMPIVGGENVVMRILASHIQRFTLEDIGLGENDYEKVVRASSRPHGMVLVVGPTGSGKTTTLYTILEILNTPEVNIMTIEDPVEFNIEGVQQTQVNPKKKLTFSTGLRSIVRQDPDMIMVGEIRDEETADIAVNAAMTGHLLLSTLHTNDAATTFPRLIEMGIEPFLAASSVNVIIAIRLVRIICDSCKRSYLPDKKELKMLAANPKVAEYLMSSSKNDDLSQIRLYTGAGCKTCGQSGYSGRIGIFEVLEVDEDIRLLITQKKPAETINKKAIELGMTPILFDGIRKVIDGTTTLEEVIKATKT